MTVRGSAIRMSSRDEGDCRDMAAPMQLSRSAALDAFSGAGVLVLRSSTNVNENTKESAVSTSSEGEMLETNVEKRSFEIESSTVDESSLQTPTNKSSPVETQMLAVISEVVTKSSANEVGPQLACAEPSQSPRPSKPYRPNLEIRQSVLDEMNDDALPPIPGTRRLGHRRLSRAQNPVLMSSELSPHGRKNSILALNVGPMSPNRRYYALPPMSPAASKLRIMQQIEPTNPFKENEWNAEAFRMKRREAQKALELLPKYTAALKNADHREAAFENIMQDSIDAHLEDEYHEAVIEMVRERARARALLAWKAAAASIKKRREVKISRPPSFSSKLELLASQGGRVPSRAFAKSRGGSSLIKTEDKTFQTPARSRVDSSVTTVDVTDRTELVTDDLDLAGTSEESESAKIIKQLYNGAAIEEERIRSTSRKSNRMSKMVSALRSIASSRRLVGS